MFGKGSRWKAEYGDTIYKIYDWDSNLTGYLFPNYGDIEPKDMEDQIIEEMNKSHSEVNEFTLLLPMIKLNLLDNHEGMDLDFVVSSLEVNLERAGGWKEWLHHNGKSFKVMKASVHTAREDRNMLSIALGLVATIKLGEKEIRDMLSPLLDKLHEDGFL